MLPTAPVGARRGDQVFSDVVPIVVDGAAVDVRIASTWMPAPSRWPAVLGAVLGVLVVVAAFVVPTRRVWGPVLVGVGGIAAVVGWIGYASLPGVTGPRPVWWLLPVLAVAFGIAAWVLGPTPGGYAAAAIAGLELAAWAFDRRTGLSKALLPTDAPYWIDRAVTAGAFTVGCRRGRRRDRRPGQVDPLRLLLDHLDELVLVEGADVAQDDLVVIVDDQGHRQRRRLQRRRQLAVRRRGTGRT